MSTNLKNGFLRSKYHRDIQEVKLFDNGLDNITILNVDYKLYTSLQQDLSIIRENRINNITTVQLRNQILTKYGFAYKEILIIGKILNFDKRIIINKMQSRFLDEITVFEPGFELVTLFKLPFFILINREHTHDSSKTN